MDNTLRQFLWTRKNDLIHAFCCIPKNDTSFEPSIFWPSDTERQMNESRFSDSKSLSFKTRVMPVTCFYFFFV